MRLRSGADLAGPSEAEDSHEATATSATMDQESISTDEFSSTAVEGSPTTRKSLSIADSHHQSRSPAPESEPTFLSLDLTSESPSQYERSFRRPRPHRPILPRPLNLPRFQPPSDPPANPGTDPSYPLSRYTHATEQAPFPSEDAESRKRRISEVSESGVRLGLEGLAQPTERDKLGSELDEMGRLGGGEEGLDQGVQEGERGKPRTRRSPRKRRRDDGSMDGQGGDGRGGNDGSMGNGNGMADGGVNV